MSGRCVLVYALAPDGTSARERTDLLNEYAGERQRGLVVWHHHFVGAHSVGALVLEVQSDKGKELLDDLGPLAGWQVSVHRLTFSLSAIGFAAQTPFTLERYCDVTLEELAATELADPRFWWQRRKS